jgi:hypothetical protein
MEDPARVVNLEDHLIKLVNEEESTWKLSRFAEFTGLMRDLALDGSSKYAGAEPYVKEAIDIIPDILGEEGYINFVLGDLIKRIIRFKNQKRERDLIKIALWTYFLWMRLFPKQEKREPETHM